MPGRGRSAADASSYSRGSGGGSGWGWLGDLGSSLASGLQNMDFSDWSKVGEFGLNAFDAYNQYQNQQFGKSLANANLGNQASLAMQGGKDRAGMAAQMQGLTPGTPEYQAYITQNNPNLTTSV